MKYNTKGNEVTEKEKADKVKAIIEKNEKEVTIFILKRKIKFLELEVLQAQILKNNKGTKDEEKIKKMWQQIELFDEVTLALEELEGSDYPDEIMLLKNPNPAFGTLHILKKNMDQLEIKSRIVYSAFEKEMI